MATLMSSKTDKDVVIWALVYQDRYKKDVDEKSLNQLHQEAVTLKKKAHKSGKEEKDDDPDGADNDENNENNNNGGGGGSKNANLLPGEELGRTIAVPDGKYIVGLLSSSGSRIDTGLGDAESYRPILAAGGRHMAPSRYQQRTSLPRDIYWRMVSLEGTSYDGAFDREDAALHMMGPARTSRAIRTNLDKDVFVIDRSALASVDRPREGGNASAEGDSVRAKKARSRIDSWIFRPQNIAFNVNDPGSIFIYIYYLDKAERHGDAVVKSLLEKRKSVTFFSGPIECNHDDCDQWRDKQCTKMRPPATKRILGHPWWAFADFCPLHTTDICFKGQKHAMDVILTFGLTNLTANHLRGWAHALLNHSYLSDGYRIQSPGPNTLPILFRSRGNCLVSDHFGGPEMTQILGQVANVGPCYSCGEQHPPAKKFEHYPIQKDQATGLIYLHYETGDDTNEAGPSSRPRPEEASSEEESSEEESSEEEDAGYKGKGKGKAKDVRRRGTGKGKAKGKAKQDRGKENAKVDKGKGKAKEVGEEKEDEAEEKVDEVEEGKQDETEVEKGDVPEEEKRDEPEKEKVDEPQEEKGGEEAESDGTEDSTDSGDTTLSIPYEGPSAAPNAGTSQSHPPPTE
ncbi:hypothetical protein K445DRAFT_302855 [Daldinia sp. EC12]|nr:hypothetical protein K445DRAFT_302855 [Daldinia sp. EC12]